MTLSLQNDSNKVAYLCPGEKYFIVCCTNQTYLQWVIQVPTYNYSLTCDLGINVSSPVDNCLWWHNNIEDTAINCTKNSEPEVLPLTSTLLINSTNTSFNRTVVECNEGYTLNNIPDCHNYSCYNYSIESISIRSIHVINGKVFMHVAKYVQFDIIFILNPSVFNLAA